MEVFWRLCRGAFLCFQWFRCCIPVGHRLVIGWFPVGFSHFLRLSPYLFGLHCLACFPIRPTPPRTQRRAAGASVSALLFLVSVPPEIHIDRLWRPRAWQCVGNRWPPMEIHGQPRGACLSVFHASFTSCPPADTAQELPGQRAKALSR